MKKKIIYGITTVLAISLLTGCGAAKLKNGEELVAKVDNYKISADDLYSEMKEKYAVKTLIDNIDHQLLDTTYKTDETETKAIENQIEEIKKTYGSNDQIFEQIIKQVYNVESVDELKSMLSLDYKRDLAIKDYVKEKVVTDEEVTTYYDTKVIGDVKASHILIKSNAKDSDSEETKTKKENEAKKKAEEIIKKLDNGEDFAKLAKKYSDDKGTASKGGNLGYFNMDDDFEENFVSAAAALKKGAYSKEPVKTKYGYEIILKVDEKDKKKKDDLESTIRQTLADEKIKEDSSTTTYYKRLRDWRESKGLKFEDKELKKMYDKYMKTLTKEDENE
ncbi:MAG: peptidylprolyl isomerase [Clostridium sp.]|jgi:foldase protein prsA|nr:peptidylprolyl isomerase [Clostridium sp.]MEE0091903.1 peptidylprolyl isomerase [Bacilli bacterium]